MPSFHVVRLDGGLRDVGELGRVRSIQVDRSITDKASTLESCTMEIDCEAIPSAGWFRIEHRFEGSKDALGVFWLTCESTTINHGIITARLAGVSVLSLPAADTLPPGSWARAGVDAPQFAANMLAACPLPPIVSGSAALPGSIVFGDKCSALEAAWLVLDAVGWRLRTDGYGRVHIEPLPDAESLVIGEDTRGVMDGLSIDGDTVTYTRRYSDELRCGDAVRVHMPRISVEVAGRVLSQSFSASAAMTVSEKIGAWAR